MKILVYGAGILGSYLAYELSEVGHDVYILARGKRYDELQDNGLVIEHYIQKKTTKSNVKVIESFNKTDEYDAVFVVMQKTQIDNVVPILAANEKCKLYILVGNNGKIEKTYSEFMNSSTTKPTVLFGFQGTGGRKENGKVISIHTKKVDFAIGDINRKTEYKHIINNIFEGTNIKIWCCDNIDAWFKYHLAIVMPLAYAVHWANGDMKKLCKSRKTLYLALQSIKEGIAVLEQLDYPLEPKSQLKMLKLPNWIWYLPLRIISGKEIARLAIRDHSMAAINEMSMLHEEFNNIKKKSNVKTPSLDKLGTYLIKDNC